MAKAREDSDFGLSKPTIRRRARRRSWKLFATGFHAALASTQFATFRFSARCNAARSARGRSTSICKKPSIPIRSRRSRNSGRSSRPDKIMQTENDYDRDVFNGDLGTVLRIDEVEGSRRRLRRREIEYPFGELDTLVPPMRRRSISRKVRNIPPSSSRSRPALHHAGAQSRLHGRHARQASRSHRRSAPGDGDRGAQRRRAQEMDEAPEWLTAN